MPTNVVMPQMGESIAEGTIVRSIKKVGDTVHRDEPLFEISTDKVDAEIPSPAAGVLTEIKVKEGETVAVDSVVGVIGQAGEAAARKPATAVPPGVPAASHPPTPPESAPAPAGKPLEEPAAAPPPTGSRAAAQAKAPQADGADTVPTAEQLRDQRSSPVVRKIATEHRVDIREVEGTGIGGRVTKQDILKYLESPRLSDSDAHHAGELHPAPAFEEGERTKVVPMTVMRKKIAERMIESRRISAHVHSVFEVDFFNVARIREARKAEYERVGAKLTYLAFIAKAVIDGLHLVPIVNSAVDGDNVVYRKEINLGIAVALDWGLIVPVIKHADEKNVLGLSRSIADLAERARTKQLKPEEVQGGTFTITNPGSLGTLFGMPIINQPQVAILGVGAIEKRPVVIDDAIAIRPRGYLTLGYDHRIVDGAVADEFMSHVKRLIEEFDQAHL